MHIFLLIFGICGKVSPSKSCSYARVPDSLLAEWEKSRVGLALKKSRDLDYFPITRIWIKDVYFSGKFIFNFSLVLGQEFSSSHWQRYTVVR